MYLIRIFAFCCTDHRLLFFTLNGLASADAVASKLNNVVKYNPQNRTIVSTSPPRPGPGPMPACTLRTTDSIPQLDVAGRDGVALEPSVYPVL